MPGSAIPTLVNFVFGEKPLGSAKLNTHIAALNALRTWQTKGDILYGWDIDQLERIAKPTSSGLFTMDSTGVPTWLLGGAGRLPRWNSAGVLYAGYWTTSDHHDNSVGHTNSSSTQRDMPNSTLSGGITISEISTVIVHGFVRASTGIGNQQAEFYVNIDGVNVSQKSLLEGASSGIRTVTVSGRKTGVSAGNIDIKLRENQQFGGNVYTVYGVFYIVEVIPE